MMPQQFGPPSDYAKSMSPLVIAVLVFQTLWCILRMVLLLDILGGFIMGVMLGLGWFAWKQDMNITFLCYWGILCFVNGLFDLVKLIEHLVKSPVQLFTKDMPMIYNFMSA